MSCPGHIGLLQIIIKALTYSINSCSVPSMAWFNATCGDRMMHIVMILLMAAHIWSGVQIQHGKYPSIPVVR